MLGSTRLAALAWIRSQGLTTAQAQAIGEVKDLPTRPTRLIKIGAWFRHPICQEAAFWDWDERYGSHRGVEPEVAV